MTLTIVDLSCIRQHKPLFANISFCLQPGGILLVEGPNGSGKSSLLRLLAGLATPSAGEIFWEYKLIREARTEYNDSLHYIGHANGIKPGLTVKENLRLAKSNYDESILTKLDLHAYQNTLATFLSAGQKRRLALARLFLRPKPLWVLDEPLTALDAATQELFLSHLTAHLQQGGMSIISSHQPLSLKAANVQSLRLRSC